MSLWCRHIHDRCHDRVFLSWVAMYPETPLHHVCQVLLIALLVGILRVIYFLAVRATHAAGSANASTPAVTGDSWNAAQTADAPSGNTVMAKVHQASSSPVIPIICARCCPRGLRAPCVCTPLMTPPALGRCACI